MRARRFRVSAFLAIVLALASSGCPARRQAGAADLDPGPPAVLDPTLLDRA